MAEFTVDTLLDEMDDNATTSLREAVRDANASVGADLIVFDPTVFGTEGRSVIRLIAGEIEITDALRIEGGAGVTITGDAAGDDEMVDGTAITDLDATTEAALGDNTRLFAVTRAVETTFRDLVLTGGRSVDDSAGGGAIRSIGAVTLEGVTLAGNSTGGEASYGGGLYALDATLSDTTVIGNRTEGDRADGGGLFTARDATLTNVTVLDNRTGGANADGGGLYARRDVVVKDGTISGNRTEGFDADGGGVFARGETDLTDVTLSGNWTEQTNADGGGLFAREKATLTNVTFSDNRTEGDTALGGGFYAFGAAALANVTISGNRTLGEAAQGGGFFARGDATLTHVTATGNRVEGPRSEGGGLYVYGSAGLTDSIVLGNDASSGGGEIALGPGAADGLSFVGASIVGADASAFDATESLSVTNAPADRVFAQVEDGAGVLGANGGPTRTVLILGGGPAQDAARGGDGPSLDQRGVARPDGAAADIGAVELRLPPVLADDSVVLPFGESEVRIATLLANDLDPTGDGIEPSDILLDAVDIVRRVGPDLVLTQSALASLIGGPIQADGTGGSAVTFTYGLPATEDGVVADPAEVVLRMAAALRLRDATVEAEAGGRAVVDVSALREGGFGEVSISLGPVRATDGAGGSIGTAALVAGELVFTADAGAAGRSGAVEVTAIDGLGQVGGSTIALEVAPAVVPPPPSGGEPGAPEEPIAPGEPTEPEESVAPEGPNGSSGEDGAPGSSEGGGSGGEGTPPGAPGGESGEETPGPVLLRGTEGRDRIFGTAEDERFEGLGARDVLLSGGGEDVMTGGDGPDFFAFARVPERGRTEITDFGRQDFVVLDDRFFGLGGPEISLRGVTVEQVLTASRLDLVAIDRQEGTLTVDPGRDASGPAPLLTIDLGAGLASFGAEDVFLA